MYFLEIRHVIIWLEIRFFVWAFKHFVVALCHGRTKLRLVKTGSTHQLYVKLISFHYDSVHNCCSSWVWTVQYQESTQRRQLLRKAYEGPLFFLPLLLPVLQFVFFGNVWFPWKACFLLGQHTVLLVSTNVLRNMCLHGQSKMCAFTMLEPCLLVKCVLAFSSLARLGSALHPFGCRQGQR